MKQKIIRRWRSFLHARAKRRLKKNIELWNMLQKYIQQSKSTGCSYSDYWVLYNYIRIHKPVEVLECGTGVSTIVMAYAMFENEKETGVRARLTSMEQMEPWYKVACDLLPENLKKYVEIILSSVVEDQHSFFRGVRYADTPKRDYEFVFVDGPKTGSSKDHVKTFDFDFIWAVRNSTKPVVGILDLRLSTYFVLREIFGRKKTYFDTIRSIGFIGGGSRGPCSKDDLRTTNEIVVSHVNEF